MNRDLGVKQGSNPPSALAEPPFLTRGKDESLRAPVESPDSVETPTITNYGHAIRLFATPDTPCYIGKGGLMKQSMVDKGVFLELRSTWKKQSS